MTSKSDAISVLFVCHGNICRSTMAHQYLQQLVLKAPEGSPLKRIEKIDSCGTGTDDLGSQPDPGTQKTLENHGLPRLNHIARQFESKNDKNFDIILCMDTYNMMCVKRFLNNAKCDAKIELLGKYDPEGVTEVFNPWHCPLSYFEKCYDHVSRCIDKFVLTLS